MEITGGLILNALVRAEFQRAGQCAGQDPESRSHYQQQYGPGILIGASCKLPEGHHNPHRSSATSDQAEKNLYEEDLTGPAVFVMGREETGVSKRIARRCDLFIRLPMLGEVASLNVSVATGICLFEARRQRG